MRKSYVTIDHQCLKDYGTVFSDHPVYPAIQESFQISSSTVQHSTVQYSTALYSTV